MITVAAKLAVTAARVPCTATRVVCSRNARESRSPGFGTLRVGDAPVLLGSADDLLMAMDLPVLASPVADLLDTGAFDDAGFFISRFATSFEGDGFFITPPLSLGADLWAVTALALTLAVAGFLNDK